MKVLERPLLAHLSNQVNTFQDTLQFAYCPGFYVEIYLLQQVLSHLDKAGSLCSLISPVLLKFSSLR